MADRSRRPAAIDADILARKGNALPAGVTAEAPQGRRREPAAKRTALTVKVDDTLYAALSAYCGQTVPRRSHQEVLEEALRAFLDVSEAGNA